MLFLPWVFTLDSLNGFVMAPAFNLFTKKKRKEIKGKKPRKQWRGGRGGDVQKLQSNTPLLRVAVKADCSTTVPDISDTKAAAS